MQYSFTLVIQLHLGFCLYICFGCMHSISMCSLHVGSCGYMYMCVGTQACVYICVEKLEVNTSICLNLSPLYFFDLGFLSVSRAHGLTRLDGQKAPEHSLLHPLTLSLQHTCISSFNMDSRNCTPPLMLTQWTLYTLSHLSNLRICFFKKNKFDK